MAATGAVAGRGRRPTPSAAGPRRPEDRGVDGPHGSRPRSGDRRPDPGGRGRPAPRRAGGRGGAAPRRARRGRRPAPRGPGGRGRRGPASSTPWTSPGPAWARRSRWRGPGWSRRWRPPGPGSCTPSSVPAGHDGPAPGGWPDPGDRASRRPRSARRGARLARPPRQPRGHRTWPSRRHADPRPDQAAHRADGRPPAGYPVVHLTGTNGKGSTARLLTALLGARGLKVGTYTSPHLERINERLTADGEPIPDDELAEVLAAVAGLEPLMEQPPTWFEIVTAAAFRWFADVAVDVGRDRGGPRRDLGRDQRRRRPGGGRDQREPGPRGDPRPGPGRHRRREGGNRQARQRAGAGRDRPRAGCRLPPGRCGRGVGARGRPSAARTTGWPTGGDCSTSEPSGATTRACSSRCTGPTRATTPPPPWPRPRPSSARRFPTTWFARRSAAVRNPGRMEVVGRRPLCLLDGAAQSCRRQGCGCHPGRGVRRRRPPGGRARPLEGTRPGRDARGARPLPHRPRRRLSATVAEGVAPGGGGICGRKPGPGGRDDGIGRRRSSAGAGSRRPR